MMFRSTKLIRRSIGIAWVLLEVLAAAKVPAVPAASKDFFLDQRSIFESLRERSDSVVFEELSGLSIYVKDNETLPAFPAGVCVFFGSKLGRKAVGWMSSCNYYTKSKLF